jgi:hypothetical protein
MVASAASPMVSASDTTGSYTTGFDTSSPDTTDPMPSAEPRTAELVAQLSEDRLWLLRQLDAGCWPQWRLDLAALERELGQVLDQARERPDL